MTNTNPRAVIAKVTGDTEIMRLDHRIRMGETDTQKLDYWFCELVRLEEKPESSLRSALLSHAKRKLAFYSAAVLADYEDEQVVAEDADEGDLHYVPQDLGEGVTGVPADTTTPMIEDAPVMKAYRGGLSYDTFENGEQYLCDHCLTRAADGSVLYLSFGTAHRVIEVFASGGDYLTYESAPFTGAWDVRGEWLSDSEADPEGYDRCEAVSEARAAAGLEALQDLQIEWEKEENSGYQRGSQLAILRNVKIEGLDE